MQPPIVLFSEEQAIILLGYKMLCVRLALILWPLLVLDHDSLQETSVVVLPRLSDRLAKTMDQCRGDHLECAPAEQELFFWVTSVGLKTALRVNTQIAMFLEYQNYFAREMAARPESSIIDLFQQFLPISRTNLYDRLFHIRWGGKGELHHRPVQ